MKIVCPLRLLIVSFSVSVAASAQKPVEIDATPLARPASLCAIQPTDPEILMDSIQNILSSNGFTVDAVDNEKYEMTARKDKTNEDGFGKTLIWLE